MASAWFNRGMYLALSSGVTLTTDTIGVLLLQDSYTFDATDNVVNDLTPGSNECTGGSYARQNLGTKSVTEDDGGGRAYFDAADSTFSAVPAQSSDIDAAVVFKTQTNDTVSQVLYYLDWTAITGNGSDITVQWSASGIAEIT